MPNHSDSIGVPPSCSGGCGPAGARPAARAEPAEIALAQVASAASQLPIPACEAAAAPQCPPPPPAQAAPSCIPSKPCAAAGLPGAHRLWHRHMSDLHCSGTEWSPGCQWSVPRAGFAQDSRRSGGEIGEWGGSIRQGATAARSSKAQTVCRAGQPQAARRTAPRRRRLRRAVLAKSPGRPSPSGQQRLAC